MFETNHCYQEGLFKIKKIYIKSSVIIIYLLMALFSLESDFRFVSSTKLNRSVVEITFVCPLRPRVLFSVLP
jgi:hypothetical protein